MLLAQVQLLSSRLRLFKDATYPRYTVLMNQAQIDAAYKLLNLMDADAVAQADATIFGDWYSHLCDHILEALEGEAA